MIQQYQVLPPNAPVSAMDDILEAIAREGAQRIVQRALQAEVDDFLGRGRYQRSSDWRGYRNGYLPKRTIGVGMGAVDVRIPRVSDVPEELAPDGFHSAIIDRYQRRSKNQARLLCRLYLEGMASGDFEPVFRALVGATAALSPNTVRELSKAPTREDCTRRREEDCTQLRADGQEAAATCLERDWDDFTTFYDFPQEHWTPTCAPPTPSTRFSTACGYAPTPPAGCTCARTRW